MHDVIIIGAGAAGLMSAYQCAKNNLSVLLLERNEQIGQKIKISGGGRCNFTNLNLHPENYLSENPHFMKSALATYPPENIMSFFKENGLDYFEKKDGQLFCKKPAKNVVELFSKKCHQHGVVIKTGVRIQKYSQSKETGNFHIHDQTQTEYTGKNLIIATGGISFPKIGATDFGYKLAKFFDYRLVPQRPGLVPLVYPGFKALAGVSLKAKVRVKKRTITDDLLFTHKGFSGPVILKTTLFWEDNEIVTIDFLPSMDVREIFNDPSKEVRMSTCKSLLANHLPNKFLELICQKSSVDMNQKIGEIKKKNLQHLARNIHEFQFTPKETEGLHKAEVTKGGVSTKDVSGKTMEGKKTKGLYFVGEVLDVTGQLGGYNFAWAWASAVLASNAIGKKLC
jgi:predicted Rossmann fold flavoprotein